MAWLIESANKITSEWNVLGFIDDAKKDLYGKTLNGLAVLGGREWFDTNRDDVWVTCAMGSSKARRAIYAGLEPLGHVKVATLIDGHALVASTASISEGSIICAGARVMVNARVGEGVVVNTGSSVGHDAVIGPYSTLFVNVMISGSVTLGEGAEIGSGAFIREKLAVCGKAVIAPLSSVLRDITEPGTYAGNPARRIV